MKRYAEDSNYWNTTIAPAKSQAEIRQLVENFGATNPAIMQGEVRGQPAWMVRFDWHGYTYRYIFTSLECKEPNRMDFFGWKRHSHADQACFQMGREAVDFVKAVLSVIKRRDNLETITNSLKRLQNEDGAGNLVDFRIVTTEPHYIHFKGGIEKCRLYSTTSTVNNKQAARLKSIGWQSLPCKGEFGFYQEWRAKTDTDRMFIAEEVIRTFTEVYGLTSNELLGGVNIVIGGITVESITAKHCGSEIGCTYQADETLWENILEKEKSTKNR